MKIVKMLNRVLAPWGAQLVRTYSNQDKDWDGTFLEALKRQQAEGIDPNSHLDQVWGKPDWVHHYEPLIRQGDTVCEVGPGLGRWTNPIVDRVKKLYLVDYSRHVCQFWREKNDPRFVVVHSGNSRMPQIPDASVDFAMSWDVFVHMNIEQIYGFLQEFSRILRPGGKAMIDHLCIMNADAVKWFKKDMVHAYDGTEVRKSIFGYHHPETIRILAEDLGFTFHQVMDAWYTHSIVTLVRK